MIPRPARSTPLYSSAASDVYKRQGMMHRMVAPRGIGHYTPVVVLASAGMYLSLIHISEPTRLRRISYAVFCLKKKKKNKNKQTNKTNFNKNKNKNQKKTNKHKR